MLVQHSIMQNLVMYDNDRDGDAGGSVVVLVMVLAVVLLMMMMMMPVVTRLMVVMTRRKITFILQLFVTIMKTITIRVTSISNASVADEAKSQPGAERVRKAGVPKE